MALVELLQKHEGSPMLAQLESALAAEEAAERLAQHDAAAAERLTLQAQRAAAVEPLRAKLRDAEKQRDVAAKQLEALTREAVAARRELLSAELSFDTRLSRAAALAERTAGPAVELFASRWRARIEAAREALTLATPRGPAGIQWKEDQQAARAAALRWEGFQAAREAVQGAVLESRNLKVLPTADTAAALAALEASLATAVRKAMGKDAHLMLEN